MSERAPYSRIYWAVVDDPKFADVVDDDRAWALWTRLLMAADQSWPASPMLPLSTHRRSLDKLVAGGIVDLQAGGRYRIHGLDAERERRKQAATRGTPTGDQLGTKRDADGPRTTGLRQDEPHQDKTSSTEPTAPDPADIYWNLTGKYPSGKALPWIDGLTAEFGASAVVRALAGCHQQDNDQQTFLGRVQDVLRHDARQLDKREQDAERARVEANRPPKGVNVPLLIAHHNHGHHAGDPDSHCPSCRKESVA